MFYKMLAMKDIEEFVEFLRTLDVEDFSTSENLYDGKSKESEIRRHNLTVYLKMMKDINPGIMMIGEAPGYKGCRLTGVPFTSEKVLATNPFFCDQGFRFINEKDKLESEQSATIVWNELNALKEKPLIWNIFPFHPFGNKGVYSNRTPNSKELDLGRKILETILGLFPVNKIIAIGRKPESRLLIMGINHVYVRHPANGGKSEFVQGLKKELCPHAMEGNK